VLLFGAVGPYARAEAFVEASATVEGPPPCVLGVLDAGLSATVGVDFLADYETMLFDKREQLAQFNTCDSDPNAERPTITWARSYGRVGSPGEQTKAVIQASDGTYLVTGESSLFGGVTGFAASMWAMRLDALGNVMWQKAFGRLSEQGLTQGVAQVPGGFLIAGTAGVIKLDSGGNPVWARTYATDPPIQITSIAAHSDGSFAVAGFHGTTPQAWAMKLDPRGNVLWSRRYAGADFAKIRVTSDGGYIAVGLITGNGNDASLTKLNQSGDVVWMRALDNRFDASAGTVPGAQLAASGERGFDVVEKPGGGYVVVGESYGNFPMPEPTPVGYYASWVANVNAGGELASSVVHRAPTGSLYGSAYAVAMRPNGSPLVVGRRADTAADLLSNEDILLLDGGAYSALGGQDHDAIYSGPLAGPGRGMPLMITADGGSIVGASVNANGADVFSLYKLNRTGGLTADLVTSLPGSSFANKDAVSTEVSSMSSEQPVTSALFTSALTVESTDLVLGYWISIQ
jgi:hypothetical protein